MSEAAAKEHALAAQQQKQGEQDDDETFLRPVGDLAGIRACYERYGVVGVTGVLTPEECTALIGEGLEPELPEGVRISDPATHHLADRTLNRYGVIGKEPLFSPSLLRARTHPRVAAAYRAVYGSEEVVCCHDRAAWMRPAGSNPHWDTPFRWPGLHLDINPLGFYAADGAPVSRFLDGLSYDRREDFLAENNAKHESMGRTVQGVLNLLDNREEDGGFHCVPGAFGARLRDWASGHEGFPAPEPNGRYELAHHGRDAALAARTCRVPCPAGTLILFDATLPHGTKPNNKVSSDPRSRAILFLRYITPDCLPPAAWSCRAAGLRRIVREVGFEPDERQASLLYGSAAAAAAAPQAAEHQKN